jgi:hypothetical protein
MLARIGDRDGIVTVFDKAAAAIQDALHRAGAREYYHERQLSLIVATVAAEIGRFIREEDTLDGVLLRVRRLVGLALLPRRGDQRPGSRSALSRSSAASAGLPIGVNGPTGTEPLPGSSADGG